MTYLICADYLHKNKAEIVAKKLLSMGHNCLMDPTFSSADQLVDSKRFSEVAGQDVDIIISIGGDGTMLRTAQRALSYDKPVFGINAGRIGFLCAFEYDNFEKITEDELHGLRTNHRMILEVRMDQRPGECYYALNDAVLNKGGVSKTIELEIYTGNSLIGMYRADGVIVSTPTGSTGYSLSAGGPIVEPSIDAVLVTPICAHVMFSRGIVLSGNEDVRIEPTLRNDTDIYLSVDSSFTFLLQSDCGVSVKRSDRTLRLLTSDKRDYYEMINRRISKGE